MARQLPEPKATCRSLFARILSYWRTPLAGIEAAAATIPFIGAPVAGLANAALEQSKTKEAQELMQLLYSINSTIKKGQAIFEQERRQTAALQREILARLGVEDLLNEGNQLYLDEEAELAHLRGDCNKALKFYLMAMQEAAKKVRWSPSLRQR